MVHVNPANTIRLLMITLKIVDNSNIMRYYNEKRNRLTRYNKRYAYCINLWNRLNHIL